MKIRNTDTCYVCGKPACSSEHAPAKSFFPSEMRKNLIEVPSCKDHNENTSMDDEYVRFIISSHFRNNEIGKEFSASKGVQVLRRSSLLAKTLSENKLHVSIVGSNNEQTNSIALKIDRDRFNKEIRKISYALFFHKYQKRWNRSLTIMTFELFDPNGQPDELGQLMLLAKQQMNNCKVNIKYEGDNPEVFKYAFVDADDTDDNKILMMVFYQGFVIWASPQPGTTGPII